MQLSTKYDVIIIGAGITGCYAAAELAKLGYSVCVLEKNAESGAKSSCTGIISRECLDLLAVGKDAIQFNAYSAKVFSPSGKYIRIKRDDPQAYVMDRPSLDRSIASEAANNGACLNFSTLASSIQLGPQYAEVHADRHSERVLLKAELVVIASGTGTALTRDVGLGQIDEFAQGAQSDVLCKDLDEVEVYTGAGVAPGFFAWLVPTGNSGAKAGLLCRGNPRRHIEDFFKMLEQRGRIGENRHDVKYGAVPLKPLPRTFAERVLVVGDAAGQVKPTTGGGIYFGILCARLAVRTIHEALGAGSLSARSLSLYQKRWHKLLKQELSIDYWAHRFYGALGDKQMEHIFDVIEQHGIHESILA
jgi:digeranylgeranylglycerophospholipid reductase